MKPPSNDFLKTAGVLGARLCRDAFWSGRRCNWLGASMEYVGNTWTIVHRAFGPEFYDGTSGIAFFLACLFRSTNEKLYRLAAEGGAEHAWSRLEDIKPATRIGFYSGLTGIAYAFVQLGEVLGDPRWVDRALKIVEGLTREDPFSQGLDVVAGSAGAISPLLHMHRKQRRDFLLDLAVRHGEHLLSKARRTDNGWSWSTLNFTTERDLTGFSHGTSGIAWALLELHRATGDARFRDAAEQGFRYERRWFNPEQENWPDFRSLYDASAGGQQTPTYAVAWCHGAPGIGLARLRAHQILGEEIYRSEAEAALRTTAKSLRQSLTTGDGNFSLCHGLAGNAELLLLARRLPGTAEDLSLPDQIGHRGIEQFLRANLPWPCGVPGGGETPNLMLGLAGIGYFYLRLHDPHKNAPVVIVTPDED